MEAAVADDAAHADRPPLDHGTEREDGARQRPSDGLGIAGLPLRRGDEPHVLLHGRAALDELDGGHGGLTPPAA